MIRKIDIVAIMTVGLMAGGCTQTDEVLPEGRVPIRLAAMVDGDRVIGSRTATRSGSTTSTTQDTELLDGQTVDAYILEKGGGWLAQPAACTVNGNEGDLTYNSDIYYPMDATPVEIYAVHPSYTSAATFTVSSGQTYADNYAASDLCYSKTAEYGRSESAQTLVFSHVLSKIVVNVDMSALGGSHTVSNLRLKAKTQTTMTYPADNANGYTLGTAATPASIVMNEGGAVVIPPQTTAADGDVRITFDVSGIGPIVYEFPASTEFASNTQYTYTVKVGNTVTVTSSITAWGSQVNKSKTVEIGRPKLPIEYVGEYNMASTTTMAVNNNRANSGYFTWEESKSCSISGYHLPSVYEWMSVIAPNSTTSTVGSLIDVDGSINERISFKQGQHLNMSETVAWGVTNNSGTYTYDVNQRFYNDYNCPNDGLHDNIGYAIRFKETTGNNGRYTCAYRYEYKTADTSLDNCASLTVKVKYIGYNQNVTISTISNEDWWGTVDFVRVFPACGYYDPSSLAYPQRGAYFSVSNYSSTHASGMSFGSDAVSGHNNSQKTCKLSVRLFKDAE